MTSLEVHVIGSGLAGSEAAYFLAERGHSVVLYEMRPQKMTPAHKSDQCAELVCSNSLKSKAPDSAPGILKAEMEQLGSLILKTAKATAIPGGEALVVDREQFSAKVTQAIESHPRIRKVAAEVSAPPPGAISLIATGPLTSDTLSEWLAQATGSEDLYFYDAIAPIIEASSIDYAQCFFGNRYGKGCEEGVEGSDAAYLNCPMTEEEYYAFVDALLTAEKVPPKPFEKEKFFQGCQPIEAIAESGRDSLRFGPMKPVGLEQEGKRAYAVVQLRAENAAKTAFNLVGFQTKLKYPEQSRIFRMIPALRKAEFLRLGSIHRNTYVCAPRVLRPDLSLKGHPQVYLAGQITGVEGYLESAACGLLAGLFIHQRIKKLPHRNPPANTGLGALLRHVVGRTPGRTDSTNHKDSYTPSNIHFGLFEPHLYTQLEGKKKDEVRKQMAIQSLENFNQWISQK